MRRLLFQVDVVAEGPDRLYVAGRSYGDLIRLGDLFTASVQASGGDQGGAARDTRPVSLLVRGIQLYRKYVNQVDPGMTAELELEFLAHDRAAAGETLLGEASTPAFADYEVLGSGEPHIKPV
jgi:hypothetical protein